MVVTVKGSKVGDVMTREVVSVREDEPFKDIVRIMHEHRVSGVPVLDADGKLVGIVTEADLLMAEEEHTEPKARGRSLLEWFLHPAGMAEIEGRAEDIRARDIMVRDVVTVTPEVPVREAIKILLDAGVKRLPVIDGGRRVVGIVSRRDLLQPFLRADEEIAAEIRDHILLHTMWIDPDTVAVAVSRGVVRLEGEVDLKSTKEILVELAHRVDGVVGVEDRVTFRTDDRKIRPERHEELAWSENWVRRNPRT